MDESKNLLSSLKGLLSDTDEEERKRIRAAFENAIQEAQDKKTTYSLLGMLTDIPKGLAGGGRMGLDTQLGEGRLGAGLTGDITYLPDAGMRRYRPTGWDISYSTPTDVFSLMFNRPMQMATPSNIQELMNPFTMPPKVMLNYLRRF
ncbi:MAG: hypothetical protein ACO24H_11025 [Polynucleobacter sp.]